MILRVFAYKDTKLNIYTQPFYNHGSKSDEDIIEEIRRMCSNPEMPKVYFEYDLYDLGTFDDKVGTFEVKPATFLCSLGDFRHLAEKEVSGDGLQG